MFSLAQTASYADNLRSTHNVSFCWKTQDFYLSPEDAEHLTNRRLQLMGTSTSSLEVYEEEFKGELVVVKRFRHDERHDPSVEDIKVALDKWKQVSFHPNIAPFLGLCSDASMPLPMLLTPRACWNLLQYVQAHPDAPKRALIYSIAAALEYMHGQDVPITHGNVKAENVLIDRNGVAYLSDIGIFQAVTHRGQLNQMEELRWSAPEKVLYQEEHTSACDTWSFAMTIIEVRFRYFNSFPR
ncbi:hypothetical protein Agabi119p4_2256 [Agaricus bisporus var. burnettii]|uniref:Protein kinase domain-containing protein n=1 Tax=Agaricus bisporus var. burnettii TaxID=192524 RepID=A0A8H7KK73_AGABI|nr:hypothetical protein Agabi119p4_2256 [Agaricus bisporus var. burnettii]